VTCVYDVYSTRRNWQKKYCSTNMMGFTMANSHVSSMYFIIFCNYKQSLYLKNVWMVFIIIGIVFIIIL